MYVKQLRFSQTLSGILSVIACVELAEAANIWASDERASALSSALMKRKKRLQLKNKKTAIV
jgi:hypothetical protein